MSSSAGGPPNVSQRECGISSLYIGAWQRDRAENPQEQRRQRGEQEESRFLRMFLSSMVIRTWLDASRPKSPSLPFLIFPMPRPHAWKLAIKCHLFYPPSGSLVHFFSFLFFFVLISFPWNRRSNKNRGQAAIFIKKKKRWKRKNAAARAQLKSIAPAVKPALRGTAPAAEG